MPPVTVHSCGIDDPAADPRLRHAAAQADLVYGSARLLAALNLPEGKGILLGADARSKAAEALAAAASGQNILILASGDALYHGIGGTILSLNTQGIPVTFVPGVTAFQTLFHRLGLPWDEARHFSAHHQETIPLREILSCPLAAVYGGTRHTAAGIARACLGHHPACAERPAILAENLGTPGERITRGTISTLAEETASPTSILLLLPADTAAAAPILPLGLDNASYSKENNLITQEDVRAVILSRLRLPAWGVLWDIGAGSGSIGLEAAALRPGLDVYGLEKNENRLNDIRRNRENLSAIRYTAVCGTAPADLNLLPAPDRIFIGGGGRELAGILDACIARLRPGGILAASAVTLEAEHILHNWRPELRLGSASIDIATSSPIAGQYTHYKPLHRIYIHTFSQA